MMNKMQDAAAIGAFMMGGLAGGSRLSILTAAWGDGGRVGLVLAMTGYAAYLMNLRDAGAKVFDQDYPGVFDYEVVCEFGRWFGDKVLESGEPDPQHCRIWLLNAVQAYWKQNLALADDEYSDKSDELDAALMSVTFRWNDQAEESHEKFQTKRYVLLEYADDAIHSAPTNWPEILDGAVKVSHWVDITREKLEAFKLKVGIGHVFSETGDYGNQEVVEALQNAKSLEDLPEAFLIWEPYEGLSPEDILDEVLKVGGVQEMELLEFLQINYQF
jgi:hypothetical protein